MNGHPPRQVAQTLFVLLLLVLGAGTLTVAKALQDAVHQHNSAVLDAIERAKP